jgi:hypothetical protein
MKRFQTKDERDTFWAKVTFRGYITVLSVAMLAFVVALIFAPPTANTGTESAHSATAAASIIVFRGR